MISSLMFLTYIGLTKASAIAPSPWIFKILVGKSQPILITMKSTSSLWLTLPNNSECSLELRMVFTAFPHHVFGALPHDRNRKATTAAVADVKKVGARAPGAGQEHKGNSSMMCPRRRPTTGCSGSRSCCVSYTGHWLLFGFLLSVLGQRVCVWGHLGIVQGYRRSALGGPPAVLDSFEIFLDCFGNQKVRMMFANRFRDGLGRVMVLSWICFGLSWVGVDIYTCLELSWGSPGPCVPVLRRSSTVLGLIYRPS